MGLLMGALEEPVNLVKKYDRGHMRTRREQGGFMIREDER